MQKMFFFFFFQAEDGIRDFHVTGVQTCALPISWWAAPPRRPPRGRRCTTRCWRPRRTPEKTRSCSPPSSVTRGKAAMLNRSTTWAVALLAATFGAGVVIGVGGRAMWVRYASAASPERAHGVERLMGELDHDLRLTAVQRD